MSSVNWNNAISEFRAMLADTDTDKRATRKQVFGNIDGENKKFWTYDKNIIEGTMQLFNGSTEIVAFSLDNPIAGDITIFTPPERNTKVDASYYWQWWTDEHVKNFLNKGAESCSVYNQNDDPDLAYFKIPPGLKKAAMFFGAELAMVSLVNYMINRRHSQEFTVEQDASDDTNFGMTIKSMQEAAAYYGKQGMAYRNDFYKGQGQQYNATLAIKQGATRRYGPQR